MDILTFISSLLDTLAWPAVILFLIFLATRNSTGLMKLIHSIRYKDFEVTLRDDFLEASELANKIRVDPKLSKPFDPVSSGHVLQLAKIDAGVAILRSWQRLESRIIEMIRHSGLVRFTNPSKFMARLLQLERIEGADLSLFERLRKIRNEVVHDVSYGNVQTPSAAEAVEYDELVETLIQRLGLANELDYVDLEE